MHTQAFIEEMKAKLIKEKAALTGEISDEETPDYGRSEEDNATELADYEAITAATSTAKLRLEEVSEALQRVEAGTYGITEDGAMIPEERLRANPAATTVIK
jgi:RNA polymerase-binding transcription factor DksA